MKPQYTRESNSCGAGVGNCDLITPRHCEGFSPKQSTSRRLNGYGLPRFARSDAFTLIELSIVLVIIGLIVGGVLVGQDLIKAAEIRSQGSQIEQLRIATNAFRLKYNKLPADLPPSQASAFGFTARTGGQGDGDNDGLIIGQCSWCTTIDERGVYQTGEPYYYWQDLKVAGLITGNFTSGTYGAGETTPEGISQWLMPAKIKNGNYLYVWYVEGVQYFGLSQVSNAGASNIISGAGLTPNDAYALDSKFDDANPQTGGVIARYVPTSASLWARRSGFGSGASPSETRPSGAYECYHNNNNASQPMQYDTLSAANELNCALSFKLF